LHRHRFLADAGKWVIDTGVIVEYRRAFVGGVVVGLTLILTHDDRVDGKGANQRDKACDVVCGLCVGGPVRRGGFTDKRIWPRVVHLHYSLHGHHLVLYNCLDS